MGSSQRDPLDKGATDQSPESLACVLQRVRQELARHAMTAPAALTAKQAEFELEEPVELDRVGG